MYTDNFYSVDDKHILSVSWLIGISPKVNVIARLKFKLIYYDIIVQYTNTSQRLL